MPTELKRLTCVCCGGQLEEKEGKLVCKYCKNTLPDSVTSIGDYAFFSCWGLTSLDIPNGVKNIGNNTVSYCDNLASVRIGNGVTSIDNYAFCDCGNLTSIQFTGTKEQWNKISKGEGWKDNVPATYVQCTDGTVSI